MPPTDITIPVFPRLSFCKYPLFYYFPMPGQFVSCLLATSLIAATVLSFVNAKCYRSAGNIAPGYSPCSPSESGAHSVCCDLRDSVCTSQGKCICSAGHVHRGGCTDPSWRSPGCPPDAETQSPPANLLQQRQQQARAFVSVNKPAPTTCSDSAVTYSFTSTSIATASAETVVVTSYADCKSSRTKATAIGVGVGVPIAVSMLLDLGFLLFNECGRRRETENALLGTKPPAYESTAGRIDGERRRGPQPELRSRGPGYSGASLDITGRESSWLLVDPLVL